MRSLFLKIFLSFWLVALLLGSAQFLASRYFFTVITSYSIHYTKLYEAAVSAKQVLVQILSERAAAA